MNTLEIVAQLKAERNRLDRAIDALEGGTDSGGSMPVISTVRQKRTMSAEARARIAAAQRARWAAQRQPAQRQRRPAAKRPSNTRVHKSAEQQSLPVTPTESQSSAVAQ